MRPMVFLFAFILSIASSFAQNIRFESLSEGRIKATGTGFYDSATGNRQVNFYHNGKFITQINMDYNGSFTYTSRSYSFQNNDTLTVKVLQYISHNTHYERTGSYYYRPGPSTDERLTFTSLPNGQMRVVGRNLGDRYADGQVNFYRNDRYFAQIRMNANGSFSYTSPMNTFYRGDRFTVKVLQYWGSGRHLESSQTYFGETPDDDYVVACTRNATNYANQRLCIELRVPSHISYACGNDTRTSENEAICLRYRSAPEKTTACHEYMRTIYNEASCLKIQGLTPSRIRHCGISSRDEQEELRCIRI